MLFQIVLTNLLIASDNVGMIAIATKHLPEHQAKILRHVGICLSPIFLFVFLLITETLFDIEWLHIRILGGVMLIYVNYNMLFHGEKDPKTTSFKETLKIAIVSIIVSNISMSLENSLTLMTIVTGNGPYGLNEFLLIMGGAIICVPLLLLFSGVIAKVMERYKSATYLCAGYLVYMAVQMILEDESIRIFLHSIQFNLQNHIAIVIAVFVVIASIVLNHHSSRTVVNKRKYLFLVLISICYAIVITILIQTVSLYPSLSYMPIFTELLDGYHAGGANAIYAMTAPPHIFPILSVFIAAMIVDHQKIEKVFDFIKQMGRVVWLTCVLILIYISVCTIGLTFLFGFGHFYTGSLFTLFLYMILLINYITVFSVIKLIMKHSSLATLLSLLFIIIEDLLVEIFILSGSFTKFAGLFPEYYMHGLLHGDMTLNFLLHCILANSILIVIMVSIGVVYIYYNRKKSKKIN